MPPCVTRLAFGKIERELPSEYLWKARFYLHLLGGCFLAEVCTLFTVALLWEDLLLLDFK